ncbi:MAG: phage integrase SAM-like domain-containing protein, partial [Bacteroidales bacterium]
MATFKAIILKHQKKSDDTYNVKIRVTSNRKSAYISTHIYVDKKDITKSFKIKNQAVIEKTDDIIREYRNKLLRISTISEKFSPHEIIEYISRDEKFKLDFIQYAKDRIKSMNESTGKAYLVAINSFTQFLGKDSLQIEELTSNLLRSYKEYLECSGLKRAVSSYPGYLRALFNMACDDYNGEHIDNWNIKHNPFSKFKVPRQGVAEKRSLSVDQIKAIINLPYRESWGLKDG